MFYGNSENLLSYHEITPPLSTTKVLFLGFGCKIQTKRPYKKRWFWTVNSVKYENVTIDAIKRNTSNLELWNGKTKVGKQGVRCFFFHLKLPNKNKTAI